MATAMDLRSLVLSSKTIAVVGLSDKPERDSFRVASYLQNQGYTVVPVNPLLQKWKGIRAYAKLTDVPSPIDIVDIFRKSEFVPEVVQEALELNPLPRLIWMQDGVRDEAAAEKARAAGIAVVMDDCIMRRHRAFDILK